MRRAALLVVLLTALIASANPPANEKAAAAWMKDHAVALRSAEAGHGFDDLAPVGKMVGDARLVALGEATHGTREFFQLKHRMLEYLVTKKGFTVFGIEASFPDSQAVNEYVLHGTGDASAALAGLGFWTWNTDEVLDMIVWMRAWNADPAHAAKVKFYGFDMQNPSSSVTKLRAYFADAGIDEKAALDTLASVTGFRRESVSVEERQKFDQSADALTKALDAHRNGTAAWELARQHVALIRQGGEVLLGKYDSNARDRYMAVNVKWILDHEPTGTKIVLWAHNGHIENRNAWVAPTMGSTLRKWYGDALIIFGFAFDHGAFQAMKDGGGGLQKMSVTAAPKGSLDAVLDASVPPLAAVDLRSARGLARDWLEAMQRTRSVGAVFDPNRGQAYFAMLKPLVAYDVVLFVAETTAAHGRVTRSAAHMPPPDPKALNLAFNEGTPGQPPPGWKNSSAAAGYRAVVTVDACASGSCVKVSRDGERTREGFGVLMQRVDATPFRGRKVRFRAKLRSEIPVGASARLWLRVDRPKGEMGFFDNMADRLPGALPRWTEIEIVGEVADDAEAIAFGLLFTGDGTAWMDEASLEVVP